MGHAAEAAVQTLAMAEAAEAAKLAEAADAAAEAAKVAEAAEAAAEAAKVAEAAEAAKAAEAAEADASGVLSQAHSVHILQAQAGPVFVTTGPFRGERGLSTLSIACLEAEVLTWLQGDDLFGRQGAMLNAAKRNGRDRLAEGAVKLEIALQGQRSSSINGLEGALVAPRMQGWAGAFKAKNAKAFEALQKDLRKELRCLQAQKVELGRNGLDLMDGDPSGWAFDLGMVQLMRPGDRIDPPHFDGGASLLMMAITLWGTRHTHLIQAAEEGVAHVAAKVAAGTSTREAVKETAGAAATNDEKAVAAVAGRKAWLTR